MTVAVIPPWFKRKLCDCKIIYRVGVKGSGWFLLKFGFPSISTPLPPGVKISKRSMHWTFDIIDNSTLILMWGSIRIWLLPAPSMDNLIITYSWNQPKKLTLWSIINYNIDRGPLCGSNERSTTCSLSDTDYSRIDKGPLSGLFSPINVEFPCFSRNNYKAQQGLDLIDLRLTRREMEY